MSEARVLLFDIENSPNLSYTWGKWQQDVQRFEQEWYLLSFAWKWLGEKQVYVKGLNDYPGYERDRTDDKKLAEELHRVLNEADVVIAHNGDSFDLPKARARFLVHGLKPPSPFKTVDTLKVARKVAMFNSNKLGDLGETLGLGSKGATGGFDTWLGCMAGDPKAWAKMKRYNKQDVVLLEQVYLRLLPYIEKHPSLAAYGDRDACPSCQNPPPHQRRGFEVASVQVYQRFCCKRCGKFFRGAKAIRELTPTYRN